MRPGRIDLKMYAVDEQYSLNYIPNTGCVRSGADASDGTEQNYCLHMDDSYSTSISYQVHEGINRKQPL